MRCWLFFDGTNRRKNYLDVSTQLFWTISAGSKPQFQAPTWYFPAGGGTWGFDSTSSIFNNGTPEQASILKLARPIILPVRQNFAARADFFNVGSESALDSLNAGTTDDQKVVQFMLDGLQTRDVQ
jgi:chitinase